MADQSVVGHVTADASRFIPPWKGTARYEVLGCLGRGGMGIVYEVFDRQRHERVALKTLLHFDPVGLYRFKQEFRTLADVLHPNLVHLHELVAGERRRGLLHDGARRGQRLPRARAEARPTRRESAAGPTVVTIETAGRRCADGPPAGGAARSRRTPRRARVRPPTSTSSARRSGSSSRACAPCTRAGKLHRDLKPSNVRVTPEGRVVILDFGVATELKTPLRNRRRRRGVRRHRHVHGARAGLGRRARRRVRLVQRRRAALRGDRGLARLSAVGRRRPDAEVHGRSRRAVRRACTASPRTSTRSASRCSRRTREPARPRPRSCAGSAPRRATRRPPRWRAMAPRRSASSGARRSPARCATPSRRRARVARSPCASPACPGSASRSLVHHFLDELEPRGAATCSSCAVARTSASRCPTRRSTASSTR